MQEKSRTKLVHKNILYSFIIKGWSGLIQILLVPTTLMCLGNYKNGIWMVFSSILIWIDSLDIGLGNGLRNKLAESLAKNDNRKAKEYVSSTFFMLMLIIFPFMLLMILAIHFSDLYSLLNIDQKVVPDLDRIAMIAVSIVCTTFVFKFIGNFYLGLQLPAVNNFLVVGGQTLALLFTFLLLQVDSHSLLWVAIANTASPLIVYLIAYPITFKNKYKELAPSIHCFNASTIKELFSLGVSFFVLQIAGIILFTTSNILLSKLFSPTMVTSYQVSYRYFSLVIMIFTVIVTPLWTAATDAYEKNDLEWIKKTMRNIKRIIIGLSVIIIVMVMIAQPVYRIWVGSKVIIDPSMSLLMAIYVFVIINSTCYSYILNGIGKLRLQLYTTCIAAIIYIPLALILSNPLKAEGIILALILVNIPGCLLNAIQYHKVINRTDKNIWAK